MYHYQSLLSIDKICLQGEGNSQTLALDRYKLVVFHRQMVILHERFTFELNLSHGFLLSPIRVGQPDGACDTVSAVADPMKYPGYAEGRLEVKKTWISAFAGMTRRGPKGQGGEL